MTKLLLFKLITRLCLSHLVSGSLPSVLEQFETLLRLSTTRRTALEDQLRLYVFEREATELQTWLTSKRTVAESKDCGQDLEDVEVSHMTPCCFLFPQIPTNKNVNLKI